MENMIRIEKGKHASCVELTIVRDGTKLRHVLNGEEARRFRKAVKSTKRTDEQIDVDIAVKY